MKKYLIISFVFCILPITLFPRERKIYISPLGDDKNPGTLQEPVKSVSIAQSLAMPSFGKKKVLFLFMDGTHYLDDCIHILPEQSGNKKYPVIYKALNPQKAIISGGSLLKLKWNSYKNGIFFAKVGADFGFIDQLYINGQRRPMARFPNARKNKNVFDCWDLSYDNKPDSTQDIFNSERIAKWKNPEGAYIHAMHSALWGDMHWIVEGKNDKGKLIYEGGWQNNRPAPMHPIYRFIENVFEELDVPGEWFFDRSGQILYYYPMPDEDIDKAKVEIVRLNCLVNFQGSEEKNISYTNFEDLIFRHVARTFMDNKEPLLRSDWTIYRGGTMMFSGAVNCQVRNCEFDQVGGNTVFVNKFNRNLLFYGCYIHESGANGFAFVGDPSSVRSPLFSYEKQDYEHMDLTKGPQNDNYPANCRVDNCLITRTGRFEKQTAPVQISMSYRITVSHCSIYDVPRSGININEGTFGGNVIEYCDIFNTVLETGDHGSFNSWGRDRYWSPDINETSRQVEKNPDLPFLDILEPNILRNNRWRCDHGWDIDLDDGSSCYRIYNNLLLHGGLKLREGYDRIVTNNIILNNTFHPHVWYLNSGDVFKHNIIFGAYKKIGMSICIPPKGKWGKEINYNLFTTNDDDRKSNVVNQCDLNSVVGNPLFVDPGHGDFRVRENSPALSVGFKNFKTVEYGVTLPSLRAIAKTPVIPDVQLEDILNADDQANSVYWHDTKLKNIETLGEQSATGLKDQCGVMVLSVSDRSDLEKCGIKSNDVILAIEGRKVCNVNDLLNLEKEMNLKGSFVMTLWRNQKEIMVKVHFS